MESQRAAVVYVCSVQNGRNEYRGADGTDECWCGCSITDLYRRPLGHSGWNSARTKAAQRDFSDDPCRFLSYAPYAVVIIVVIKHGFDVQSYTLVSTQANHTRQTGQPKAGDSWYTRSDDK